MNISLICNYNSILDICIFADFKLLKKISVIALPFMSFCILGMFKHDLAGKWPPVCKHVFVNLHLHIYKEVFFPRKISFEPEFIDHIFLDYPGSL